MTDFPIPYTRHSPFLSRLKERELLTSNDPLRRTYHISLDIAKSGLCFQPGDSLGILPHNDPLLVQRLLAALQKHPEERVTDPRSQLTMSLFTFLSTKVNLSKVSPAFVTTLLSATSHPFTQPEEKPQLIAFLEGKDLLHVVEELVPSPVPTQALLGTFLPLLPRFYSISSSPRAHEDEIHLLVALNSYRYREEIRYGVASHFLCQLANETTPIPLYVQKTAHFTLPSNPLADLIMVGPGTGVAPYRAFLQERLLQEHQGRNWLFFGGRNRSQDFFYEDFWTLLAKEEKLKLSTAFSREQEQKVYVQHKMQEEAKELFTWLEQGAFFYVCGDASSMAKDVEQSLLTIIEQEGSCSSLAAKDYLKSLRTAKRYLTDVY